MRYARALEQLLRCHTWCELANGKWKLFFGLVYTEKNYPMYKGQPVNRLPELPPWRANISHISIQIVAKRSHEKQKN